MPFAERASILWDVGKYIDTVDCMIPEPEQILLPNYDSIDKRSAVNKNVKSRVIVVRPK